jgi:hypothetical protein
MTEGEFSVCQFFVDGSYEYARRFVPAREAVLAFLRYTNNVVARLGIVTERVILTNGDDTIAMEWQRGRGITFPPEAVGRHLLPDWEKRLGSEEY